MAIDGGDDGNRSAVAAGVEIATLLGRECPVRPISLTRLRARVEAMRDISALNGDTSALLGVISAVHDMAVLAELDPALHEPAADALKSVLASTVASYAPGTRLTRLDIRVVQILRDDAARLAVRPAVLPDAVLDGAARLVRWRASFPDVVEGGGNVLGTVLGLHALRLVGPMLIMVLAARP